MYRLLCVLVYVLCVHGGIRMAFGQTTTEKTTNFTETTTFSTVEQATTGAASVTTTAHAGPTTEQPSVTATSAASSTPQVTTPRAQSVCTVDTNNNVTCNVSHGNSASNCNDQEEWVVGVSITNSNIDNVSVIFDGNDQLVLLNAVKTNRTVTFQYMISCCYASSTFTVGGGLLNSTTCRVTVSTSGTTTALTFDKDTLAHVAIACGGGIVLFVLVLCLLATVRNSMEQKPRKFRREERSNISNDTRAEILQPQSYGAPRRTTLDSVFEVSLSSSDPMASPERTRGYVSELGVDNPREGPYRADEYHRREAHEHPRPGPDRRHNDVSSGHPSAFLAQEDERLRQFSRFAVQPTEYYDRSNDGRDVWGMHHHGNEWDTPSYHRGIRWGPPADFDMY
ncbi:uncharacterized protein [Branchiostoma lanceolatum]|uniref:uncharacterized protein n=1 Tax=Branchiostoma lanceolatum TaxID=7740 RepID=UPI00345565D5